MSQGTSSAGTARTSRSLLLSAAGLLSAGTLGVLVALLLADARAPESTRPSTRTSANRSANLAAGSAAAQGSGAYRPGQRGAWAARARGEAPAQAAAERNEGEEFEDGDEMGAESLPPEWQARLRAAAHVSVVPAGASGARPPSPESVPAALHTARLRAMPEWQKQVQALLDRCVARPAQLRKETSLSVILAPPLAAGGLAPQLLSPASVSLSSDELRRLWRDTDPDALDGCLQEVRGLALAIAQPPGTRAQVMPVAFEHLLVQL